MENASTSTVSFSKKIWLCLLLCALLGLFHAFCSQLFDGYFAGLGRAIQLLSFFALGLALSPRPLRINKFSLFLSVCAILLSLSFFLFSSTMVRFLTLFPTLLCIFLALFSLSGKSIPVSLSAQSLWESLRRAFCAPFRYLNAPFSALSNALGNKKRAQGLGAALIICIPLLALVLSLLSSADAVFGNLFTQLLHEIDQLKPGPLVWKVIKALTYTLLMFSALYALTQPPQVFSSIAQPSNTPVLPFLLPITLLNAVYALFVYIQLRYLFGNAETAALSGGYAEYARSGFFQLVLVTVINLMCILPALTLHGHHKPLRCLCALLTFFTFIILASALYRMRLYISVYGLTHLRLLTLWGIAVIAGALILSLYKALHPHKRICPALFCLLLVSWIIFIYANTDYIIAAYNIAHLPPEVLDAEHLSRLSPDALPAIKKLDAATYECIRHAMLFPTDTPSLYNTGLSYLIF